MSFDTDANYFIGPDIGQLDASHYYASPESQNKRLWNKSVLEVQAMYGLSYNWDGLSSLAPSYAVVESALRAIQELRKTYPAPSRTNSAPNGAVIFEWQIAGTYLEAEIESPGIVEFMYRDNLGKIIHWDSNLQKSIDDKSLKNGDENSPSTAFAFA